MKPITPKQRAKIIRDIAAGMSQGAAARRAKVAPSTVSRLLAAERKSSDEGARDEPARKREVSKDELVRKGLIPSSHGVAEAVLQDGRSTAPDITNPPDPLKDFDTPVGEGVSGMSAELAGKNAPLAGGDGIATVVSDVPPYHGYPADLPREQITVVPEHRNSSRGRSVATEGVVLRGGIRAAPNVPLRAHARVHAPGVPCQQNTQAPPPADDDLPELVIEALPDGVAEYVEARQRDVPVDRSTLCRCVGDDLKADPECEVCNGTGLPVVEIEFTPNRPEFLHESFIPGRPHDVRSCSIWWAIQDRRRGVGVAS